MPTICSATRKGDKTVGTSTNCSANCGTGRREREEHGFCGGCGGCGSDARLVTYVFSKRHSGCTKLEWQNTWESDSWRPRHPKPSTTKNSSSSRAEKWALTSRRTECEKCYKMRQKTQLCHSSGSSSSGSENKFIGKNSGNSSKIDRRLTHVRVYTQRGRTRINLRSVSTFTKKKCEIRPTAHRDKAESTSGSEVHLHATKCVKSQGLRVVRRKVWTMGIGLCTTKGKNCTTCKQGHRSPYQRQTGDL